MIVWEDPVCVCGFLNWIHLDVTANTTQGNVLFIEMDAHNLCTSSALSLPLILLQLETCQCYICTQFECDQKPQRYYDVDVCCL